MSEGHGELWVDIGGVPVDLNSGMSEAVTNPPPGFVSKHRFVETDVVSRVNSINWFAHCGDLFHFDLSMELQAITSWSQAIESCKDIVWENAELEANNQLTLWLHSNDGEKYQNWNDIVDAHK